MSHIITLSTDFGLDDEYVGVMKGVILTLAPQATIVDLTHGIKPQDIERAAYVIQASCSYFPPHTLHLLVVDPGVGSARKIVLLCARDQFFLAPDNGVLTLLLDKKYFQAAYEVSCLDFFLQPLSATFHGRDIFAPVAARLINGLEPARLGRSLELHELTTLPLAQASCSAAKDRLEGVVTRVDHFGNLITNIHRGLYLEWQGQTAARIVVVIRGEEINLLGSTYADAAPGAFLALFGSHDYLEIANCQGNAAAMLNAVPGDTILVTVVPD